MTVFTILQEKYTEGNFGDLEASHSVFHGVFSTKENAEKYLKTVIPEDVDAQFGSSTEDLYIIESTIDDGKENDRWNR